MIFHIDGVLIIGRISQIPSWWNIECKVTIFFANTQILVYLCSIFGLKTKIMGTILMLTHVLGCLYTFDNLELCNAEKTEKI